MSLSQDQMAIHDSAGEILLQQLVCEAHILPHIQYACRRRQTQQQCHLDMEDASGAQSPAEFASSGVALRIALPDNTAIPATHSRSGK